MLCLPLLQRGANLPTMVDLKLGGLLTAGLGLLWIVIAAVGFESTPGALPGAFLLVAGAFAFVWSLRT